MKRILSLLFLLPVSLLAQTSEVGNWMIYFGNKKISDKWNWHHEVQYRNFNAIGDTEQLLLRTGIGYNLSENNNNLLFGYGFIYSEPYLGDTDAKTHFNEHRIYQQFITRQTTGRVSFQHRYRFEQRFFQDDTRLRLRYFLGITLALNRSQLLDHTLYLSTYNELFVTTTQPVFDRNRLYGGLGYRLSKYLRTEIGFMNQRTSNRSRNQLNLIAFVSF
ncbi:DUF2490 domain-containing protein [Cyclobacterium xiamenense]|uniref:DUF2490 domain-containing protein n=1 Tax=Cyclobacterium xiamenense TaxID=1297121 RepID=UPI0035D130AB